MGRKKRRGHTPGIGQLRSTNSLLQPGHNEADRPPSCAFCGKTVEPLVIGQFGCICEPCTEVALEAFGMSEDGAVRARVIRFWAEGLEGILQSAGVPEPAAVTAAVEKFAADQAEENQVEGDQSA